MRRQAISSSLIQSVGYDSEKKVLEIKYRDDGVVIQSLNVPPSVFHRLITADHPGVFWCDNRNRFKFKVVGA
jgi:KTSC domain-containing protein